jgi:hypothetical protein
MSTQFFVDETKAKGYLVAAAIGSGEDLRIARKQIDTLILPRQRSLHMKSERDSRRKAIADAIGAFGDLSVQAIIYDAGRAGTERDRRARCLEALVADAARHNAANIVFDLDETLLSWDRQRMIELTRAAGVQERVTYRHSIRHHEQMLAVPDVIAWCWARGGDWRRRVTPVVAEIRRL